MNEKPRFAGFFYACGGLSQGVGIQEKRRAADVYECTQSGNFAEGAGSTTVHEGRTVDKV